MESFHYSTKNYIYELVKFLKDNGTDICLQTNDRKNCLHIAPRYGHFKLCKALIGENSFDPQMADNDGWTALHYSVKHGSYELVTFFAEKRTDVLVKKMMESTVFILQHCMDILNLLKALVDKYNYG